MLTRPPDLVASWFVCQTLQALLQKTLRPLVDKAPADPEGLGYVGERHPIGQEENNPHSIDFSGNALRPSRLS